MIKLSVIIPSYNSAKTIATTIDSIKGQTLYHQMECIIVDGASKDEIVEIISLYNDDKNLIFSSEPDKGVYDAMNKGIKLAKGEYLYFIGADDSFYDNKVVERIFTGDYQDYDILYGNVYNVELNLVYGSEYVPEKLCRQPFCHQGNFYRRSLFDRFGLYRTDMKVSADAYFDKLVFSDKTIKSKYFDLIIANYSGSGMSSTTFDKVYWKEAEVLLNKCFSDSVPKSTIYESLIPYPRWNYSLDSLIVAFRIAYNSGDFSAIGYWMQHPFGFLRRGMRKLIQITKPQKQAL